MYVMYLGIFKDLQNCRSSIIILLCMHGIAVVQVGFDPASYTVLEGNSTELVIVREGDAEVPVTVTLLLRVVSIVVYIND